MAKRMIPESPPPRLLAVSISGHALNFGSGSQKKVARAQEPLPAIDRG
jgi:hypothetical protein